MVPVVIDYGVADRAGMVLSPARSTGSHTHASVIPATATGVCIEWREFDFLLLGPVAPGWEVRDPLPIKLERDSDGTYVYSDDIFLVYGIGETQDEALSDYISALIDYYGVLAADLSDHPTRDQYVHLSGHIHRIGT